MIKDDCCRFPWSPLTKHEKHISYQNNPVNDNLQMELALALAEQYVLDSQAYPSFQGRLLVATPTDTLVQSPLLSECMTLCQTPGTPGAPKIAKYSTRHSIISTSASTACYTPKLSRRRKVTSIVFESPIATRTTRWFRSLFSRRH